MRCGVPARVVSGGHERGEAEHGAPRDGTSVEGGGERAPGGGRHRHPDRHQGPRGAHGERGGAGARGEGGGDFPDRRAGVLLGQEIDTRVLSLFRRGYQEGRQGAD